MKVDFDSPVYIIHMIEGQLNAIKLLRSQIAEEAATCKEWLAILENLDDQEKLLQELKSRLEKVHG